MSKDRQPIIICLLALIVALVGVPEVGAMAPDTRLRIEPVDLVVGLGETFVIQVVIEEANNLGAFQFNLAYDPSILQVTEATLGAFLESTGNLVIPVRSEVNNAEGKVTFGAVSLGSAPGPSGTGVLATLTCIAQGEGSTALSLQEVQVLDMAANIQPITVEDGQAAVRDTQAPTATTTATFMPVATATPAPGATATAVPAATATSMPTNTPKPMDTPPLTATALPSPTPIVTRPAAETPTEPPTPSPSPMPSVSMAPTETKPTEVTTPMAVPTTETTQAPATPTTIPTSPPAAPAPPSPSPTPLPPSPMPSPTPLATISVPAATGPSGGVVLGLILAALAVAIVAVFILSRRPEG